MRKSIVKAKLSRNEPVLITCLHLTDPSVHELVGLMGFDAIWLDMEHHGYSLQTATGLMRASRVGNVDIMARPAKWEYMRMCRMFEAGAFGVLYPRCSDAAEAAEVVKWAKFAPEGKRGFDGGNPDMPYCTMTDMKEYTERANANTWIVIQLEEQSAVDRAEEIAAVKGVDAIFLGPADFTVLSGIPGQFSHPLVEKTIAKIAQAARNTGKHWGMPVGTTERCRQLMDMGARVFCHGADILAVKNHLEAIQKSFGPLGFTFDNQIVAGGRSYMEKA